jgi:ribonuclease P protein subunit RPR2
MAKEKGKKGVPNKHLNARIAYLNQAAEYLTRNAQAQKHASISNGTGTKSAPGELNSTAPEVTAADAPQTANPQVTAGTLSGGLPNLLSSHLRIIAQKAQIRLPPELKHSICKTCSAPLLEGLTSIKTLENLSRYGKKSWADVVVVDCVACGTCKRFPVGAKRQGRKEKRAEKGVVVESRKEGDAVAGSATEEGIVDVEEHPEKA